MTSLSKYPAIAASLLLLATSAVCAGTAQTGNYAQFLMAASIKTHPSVRAETIVVDTGSGHQPVVVTANATRKMSAAQLRAKGLSSSGPDAVTTRKTAHGWVVSLPLDDVAGRPVGRVRIAFKANVHVSSAAQSQASHIAKALSSRVLKPGNLLEPFPYVAHAPPTDTVAQALVDRMLKQHPQVLIIGLHANMPGNKNVILASNIGRIGKAADDDDMRVIKTGKANLEVNKDGTRFEVELPLLDRAGATVGAVGIVFAYKQGDDKQRMVKWATAIRDEMRRAIASASALAART